MASDMSLRVEIVGTAGVVHVDGELDLSTVRLLDESLEQLVGQRLLIVELSRCRFVDSSALRSLVTAQRTARESGNELAVVAPSEPARRIFEISSLDSLIPIFPTIAEAAASVD